MPRVTLTKEMDGQLVALRDLIRAFAEERDWDHQYHSPKNLAMALTAEVGELVEIFQWLTEEASNSPSPDQRTAAAEEIADVQIYLIRLADKLNIDLEHAVRDKVAVNAVKYPHAEFRGSARKYNERVELPSERT